MRLPLLGPFRDLLAAHAGVAAGRAATIAAMVLLALVAVAFLVAAGFGALMPVIGFPATALVFAVLFAFLALGIYLLGRMRAARRVTRVALAKNRVKAELAVATAVARSSQPLLPIVAGVAAFLLARRL